MKAIILAAGFGTRLRPLTSRIAKPALPFFNRSIIAHLIDQLRKAGIREIAINLHHAPASIRRVVRKECHSRQHHVYSFEPDILGTGGVLGPLASFIDNNSFILINGDVLIDISVRDVIDAHEKHRPLATLVLHPPSVSQGFPPLGGSQSGVLTRFPYGRLKEGRYDWCGTFTGLHVIEPNLLNYLKPKKFQSITEDLYAAALAEGQKIRVYRHDGYWNDIGTPARYVTAHLHAIKGLLPNMVGSSPDQFCLGEAVRIGRNFHHESAVIIGDSSRIGDNVCLRNVLVMPGTKVKNGTSLTNGIIYEKSKIIRLQNEIGKI